MSYSAMKDRPKYMSRIRILRQNRNLTQQDVAKYLGTSQTMYARYERGANELPIHHLQKLRELYQVSADYLLGNTGEIQERNADVL